MKERSSPRRKTDAPAVLHCRGRFQRARVSNYSDTGLQLSGVIGVSKSDEVVLELAGGKIAGRIKWVVRNNIGVAFDQPLTGALRHILANYAVAGRGAAGGPPARVFGRR